MEETLINFETAKLAKEKGFNILNNTQVKMAYVDVRNNDVIRFDYFIVDSNRVIKSDKCGTNSSNFEGLRRTYITKDIPKEIKYEWYLRPTQSLLQKWLREVHNIGICLTNRHTKDNKYYSFVQLGTERPIKFEGKGYEQALEVGLLEALKLIK